MMGFFDSLISSIGGNDADSSVETCPDCGGHLDTNNMGEGFAWCESCDTAYHVDAGAPYRVTPGSVGGAEQGDCIYCQASLSGAVSYMPYEDGSNPEAYIVCPSCGEQNIREGMGDGD